MLDALKAAFLPPKAPLLVVMNEAGVSIHDLDQASPHSDLPKVFPALKQPFDAFESALAWIAKSSALQKPHLILTFGGKFSFTVFSRGDKEDDRIDLRIAKERGDETTVFDFSILKSTPESVVAKAFVGKTLVDSAAKFCTNLALSVIWVDSLPRFLVSLLVGNLEIGRSLGVSFPFEFLMLRKDKNGEITTVSDVVWVDSKAHAIRESILTLRSLQSKSFEKLVQDGALATSRLFRNVSLRNVMASPLAKHCLGHLLHFNVLQRSSKMLRYGTALTGVLLISGIIQAFALHGNASKGGELSGMRDQKQSLQLQVREAEARKMATRSNPQLSAATTFGRLAQKKITGVYLKEVTLALTEDGEYTTTVKGMAPSEARIFSYQNSLASQLPDYEIALESIEEVRTHRQEGAPRQKEFSISVGK